MIAFVNINSKKNGEVNRFLSKFYNNNMNIKINNWEKNYSNPIEIADIIGVYTDNYDDFDINIWVSLDEGVIFKVSNTNGNEIIKYLFERYPY
ncbi:MAG: hypothetical protein IKF97_04205 [Clostridia bacterium]|nr:hypothetical protein [Clostridia bacterium]